MIQPPSTSPKNRPPAKRRRARTVLSATPEARAIQIGVAVTILVHVLFLAFAPKIEKFLDRGATDSANANDWASKPFQIEVAPELTPVEPPKPLPMPKFVEANPNAPDNVPDKTDNIAAQNQQVAQETPSPKSDSDAPAVKAPENADTTAIVSGKLTEPQIATRPTSTAPEQPEVVAKEAVRKEQVPLAGSEKNIGDNPDGLGSTPNKLMPNATDVPERVEGVADSKNTTGAKTGLYFKVDPKKPQKRPTLAPSVVQARNSPLKNREFGTDTVGPTAYNAKWSAYGEYMQKFVESVEIQWNRIVQQGMTWPVAGTLVKVKFVINSQGKISKIVSVESNGGGKVAEQGCVAAIVARDPYGDWPEDMIAVLGTEQEITFTFLFN